MAAIDDFTGHYAGSGGWYQADGEAGPYDVTHRIEATAGGFVLAFAHIFDNGDPPVEARFEMRMGFGPLFIVTAGGREIGKGHLFGDVLHYTMEFPGNTVETTCIRTEGGLRITGSASRNADGLAIAWEETLERA
ncbi:hypothetical protein GLS40_02085 [Pseudooceanicola sp. 216_PA32_1]|uniref:T3SS negative regulator,GrlR n=1 Tax=Pseudooceanicola pacificus TaxID=2676438 RepID=A0A844WDD6_9RHOB|nr:hypothetical protein [Pseudooceanicola pacificus]MWB76809.1 hypothetical protein [Pseudooceanicola pacificus]